MAAHPRVGQALGREVPLDPELAKAAADPREVPLCPAGGMGGQGTIQGGDGPVRPVSPLLSDGEIFKDGAQRELSLAGFQYADRLREQVRIAGEHSTGVDGAGQRGW